MPRTEKKNPVQARWQLADENFRLQIDMLMVKMRVKNLGKVAEELGIARATVYKRYHQPSGLLKREERMLASLFERYGLRYDPALGEGAEGSRPAANVP